MANSQSFESHVVVPRSWFVAVFFMLFGVIAVLTGIGLESLRVTGAGAVLVGVGALIALGLLRRYALTLQNRVIRAEMRARLKDVRPNELRPRIPELSSKQLIGLRFASDAEIPSLTRKILDQPIEDATEIKKLVVDWQPDFDRV